MKGAKSLKQKAEFAAWFLCMITVGFWSFALWYTFFVLSVECSITSVMVALRFHQFNGSSRIVYYCSHGVRIHQQREPNMQRQTFIRIGQQCMQPVASITPEANALIIANIKEISIGAKIG